MNNIGEKIRTARKIKNISQEELADLVNVSRQTIYKWESGVICPSRKNAEMLCNVLNISMEYFYGDKFMDDKSGKSDDISVTDIKTENHSQIKASKNKGLLIAIILLSLIFVISAIFTIILGFVVLTPNVGDAYVKGIDFDNYIFYIILTITLIIFLVILLLLVALFKKKRQS